MMDAGLRIDVDTLRGTRTGVPNLVKLLDHYNIQASFFFSVGPDNMGRHLWRLLRPAFMMKMLRTNATSLYGWDILLKGVFWPGPVIGKQCGKSIQEADRAGHEIGLHAWDHQCWQAHVERMSQQTITSQIRKGYDLLTEIIGRPPDSFAAPGWRTTSDALLAVSKFPFKYTSDCRGYSIFQSMVADRPIGHVQVPTTLPTYDELIGIKCTSDTYNDHIIKMIQPDRLNILTIHAEVEGNACLSLFKDFLNKAEKHNIAFKPLGEILSTTNTIDRSAIHKSTAKGRDGWLAGQKAKN
jgi:undecaprenyl phosphate-alpha-L-ara4FN deformylase